MLFLVLCVLAFLLAHRAERGTSARPIAYLQSLYERLVGGIQSTIEHEPSQAQWQEPDDAPAPPLSARLNKLIRGHTASDRQVCGRPPTKSRFDTGSQLAYRWTDDAGQTHMTDRPPADRIATVIDLAGSKRDFTYDIQGDGFHVSSLFQGQVAAVSKRMYDTWHYLLGEERLRQSHITLKIIGGPARYDAFREKTWPGSLPNAGFYRAGENTAYVRHDPGMPEQTLRSAFHEVSHLITASHLGPTPPWFTEGLAEYFETMEVRDQSGVVRPNPRHLKILRSNSIPELHDFLRMESEDWYGPQRKLHYAAAWSLIYFMLGDDDGRFALKNVVGEAHANFCKPFPMDRHLARHYPGGLAQLEARWQRWLSSEKVALQQI